MGFLLKLVTTKLGAVAASVLLTSLVTMGYNYWTNFKQIKELKEEKENYAEAAKAYANFYEEAKTKYLQAKQQQAKYAERADETIRKIYKVEDTTLDAPLSDDVLNILRDGLKTEANHNDLPRPGPEGTSPGKANSQRFGGLRR